MGQQRCALLTCAVGALASSRRTTRRSFRAATTSQLLRMGRVRHCRARRVVLMCTVVQYGPKSEMWGLVTELLSFPPDDTKPSGLWSVDDTTGVNCASHPLPIGGSILPAQNLNSLETRDFGEIPWSVYGRTVKFAGSLVVAGAVLVAACAQLLRTWADVYLSSLANQTPPLGGVRSVVIFFGLCCGVLVAFCSRGAICAVAVISTSNQLHRRLARGVLRAPLAIIARLPTGQVLNRFSNDMDSVDGKSAVTFGMFLHTIAGSVAALGLSIVVQARLTLGVPLTRFSHCWRFPSSCCRASSGRREPSFDQRPGS